MCQTVKLITETLSLLAAKPGLYIYDQQQGKTKETRPQTHGRNSVKSDRYSKYF